MERGAVYLSLDVEICQRNFTFTGIADQKKTILTVEASEVKPVIREIIGDAAVFSLVENILPDNVEFSLIMPEGKKTLFSISVSFGGGAADISIVRTEKFTLFSLWLNNSFSFADLPLVGEYIPRQYAVSKTGFVYVSRKKEGLPLSAGDFSGLSLPYLEQFRANQNSIEFKEGENVFITYSMGSGNTLISFPDDLLILENQKTQDGNQQAANPPSADETKSSFSIREISVGTDFKDGKKLIYILLSAKLTISKFSFEVIGLHIALDINHSLNTLKAFRKGEGWDKEKLAGELFRGIRFSVQGLSLQYNSPAFSLYGGFYRDISGSREEYNGLITIKLKKIEIIALASYVKENSYSSLFAFGYLGITIPLHPAFEIKGMAIGFGLNRTFVLPSVKEVEHFPLIRIVLNNGLRPDESLKDVFSKLNKYIPAKEGSYMIIIGLRFQSFKIIDTIALVALDIENGLVFNMLGLSTMELPDVYRIKFAFSLQADFNSGAVIARGEITDGSYLLFPEVQLQGSFVFALWFSGNSRGDFLFTIGGYHPNFKVPKHYPEAAELNRLGFSLRRGNLSASMGMYFTLTPQSIMMGLIGKLYYSMDLSENITIDYWIGSETFTFKIGIEVEIKLEAHFIMFWKPFSYSADLELLFHVKLFADFWFFSININVSLHAKLSIWGPDLAGLASLDIAGYYFTVRFGEAGSRSRQLTKDEFRKEFIPQDHLKLSITEGKISREGKNTGQEYNEEIPIVNPVGFVFEFSSQVPVSDIELSGGSHIATHELFGINCEGYDETPFLHSIKVEITNGACLHQEWQIEPIHQNMPKALWSREKLTQSSVLAGDGLIKNLTTGARIRFPEPAKAGRMGGEKAAIFDETDYRYLQTGRKEAWVSKNNDKKENILTIDLQSELNDFDFILPHEEIDYTDLLNDVEAYSYHKDFTIFNYSIT